MRFPGRKGRGGRNKEGPNANLRSISFLLDPGAVETALYSRGVSFTTYVVGKEGEIDAVLEGVKVKRPTADEILSEL